MSEAQLAAILARMCADVEPDGKATTVHLFGLLYGKEITGRGRGAPGRIIRLSRIGWNGGNEIYKMLRLSPHVTVNDHAALRRRFEEPD